MMRFKTFANFLLFVVALMAFVGCNEVVTPPANGPETPAPEEKAFSFDGITIDHTSLKLNVKPVDEQMEYVVYIAEKKHFVANHIDTREELLNDDYLYVQAMADSFGMEIYDFLSQVGWLTTGMKRGYEAINLYPDTEYVVYCYGVAIDGESYEATTEVCYIELRTSAPEALDVKFDIDVALTGNVADVTIIPEEYDGYYCYYIVSDTDGFYLPEGAEFSASYMEHYRNRAFEEFNYYINEAGYSVGDFCSKGKEEFTKRLEPNRGYLILAFAVSQDDMPLLSSEPSLCYFAIEDVAMSDMTIDISVTDITAYFAELTLTPSVSNEEYACVFLSKDQVPVTESDWELMKAIIDGYQPAVFKGSWSERLMPLMPSTEYTVLAFGIDNDLPTTELFRYDFTSANADPGEIAIESIDIVKVFDSAEIIALDSSYASALAECECVAIVEAKTSKPTDKLYFWWYEGWTMIEYSEEAFLEDLLLYDYSDNPQMMDMYYSLDEQDTFFFAGIAEDDKGNLSPIYYGEPFLMSKDMCSPAEEFFDYVTTHSSDVAMLFSRYSR
ncbi:MAG: hypothetical protein IKY74_04865 [Alistipes sp.]|nr:hypothetical protein [Alistipes sp.]